MFDSLHCVAQHWISSYKLSSDLPDTDTFNAITFLPAHYFAEATLLYLGLIIAQDDFD